MQGSKLYVGNLNYGVTGEQLKELFSSHGEVKEVNVIQDKLSGRSKGFGFVEMSNSQEAESAQSALDGKDFEGRTMRVNEARPPRDRDNNRSGGGGGGGGGFRRRY